MSLSIEDQKLITNLTVKDVVSIAGNLQTVRKKQVTFTTATQGPFTHDFMEQEYTTDNVNAWIAGELANLRALGAITDGA